jgi:hypothetical protein
MQKPDFYFYRTFKPHQRVSDMPHRIQSSFRLLNSIFVWKLPESLWFLNPVQEQNGNSVGKPRFERGFFIAFIN